MGWLHALERTVGAAVFAFGTAIVIVAGAPLAEGIAAGYALGEIAYGSSLLAAVAVGSATASVGSGIASIPTLQGVAKPIPSSATHGRPPNSGDEDNESVGSNDPGTVIYPWDPTWGQDPFDEPPEDLVDPYEIHGTQTSTAGGFKPKGPGSETETETKKKHPLQSSRGDFSGLVTTFLNPVTSQILGYKGIPRKRKFSVLTRYSPFWAKQIRRTPRSILRQPFSP